MSKIWMVEGATGEYSDHCEWPVKAYVDEKKAQSMVQLCQARANEIAQFKEGSGDLWWNLWYADERKDPRVIHELDPDFRLDYTGTKYYCYPVELVEETV